MTRKATAPAPSRKPAPTSSSAAPKTSPPPKQTRRGRPDKITPENRWEVLAVVAVTGSVRRAADYVGVTESAIRFLASRDADFAARLKRARMDRRLLSEKKVRDSNQWQAHAWYLERRHHREYGRKTIIEHTGAAGGPIRTDAVVAERQDLANLSAEELEARAKEMTPEQANQLYLAIVKRARET